MIDPEQIERGEDGFPLEDVDSIAEEPSSDAADDCEIEERLTMKDNKALYRRFRDDPHHYLDWSPPGAVSGDLTGCGFACRQCWSTYGLAGKDKAKWYTPQQAAEKLIGLCQKHDRRIVRLSNGEPFLQFDHILDVSDRVLSHEMSPRTFIRIETNGLHATPEKMVRLNELAERHYQSLSKGIVETVVGEYSRIALWWSVKSFDSEWWSWHTGRPQQDWDRMMDNLEWTLNNCDKINVEIALVNEITTNEEFGGLGRYVDGLRRGSSTRIYGESISTYHPRIREIDRRMGERRVRMAKETGFFGDAEIWTEDYLMGNHVIAERFPKSA